MYSTQGWSSWNTFRCDINDTLIREIADVMVSSGLRDAGYKYVNIDDCWMEKRSQEGAPSPPHRYPTGPVRPCCRRQLHPFPRVSPENHAGKLLPFPAKFPDMKGLADYVHSKGLKFGMYTAAGTVTCEGYPASFGYERTDARADTSTHTAKPLSRCGRRGGAGSGVHRFFLGERRQTLLSLQRM